jgi:DNA (cytosine-5)-methyltransferase 1
MLKDFSFVDLFAGIGGFRIGMTAAGGSSVYSNEWDSFAATTYSAWFGGDHLSTKDIREVDAKSEIPDHDVLCAGFPCQPFSIAGVSKKKSLGRPHGFDDVKQGNLFFALCAVIEAKKPPVVLLENVRNLLGHDSGKTWQVIQDSLDSLGYEVKYQVINAAAWVPQNRRRIFIVALKRKHFSAAVRKSFSFPTPPISSPKLGTVLERKEVDRKYMLTDNLWAYLQEYSERHRLRGNGFGFKLYSADDVAGTMSARYYKDGAEILIREDGWRNPRRLTPREAARLMGFNNNLASEWGFKSGFPQVVSDAQAYKQFGNSVCPLVVREIAWEVSRILNAQQSINQAKALRGKKTI